MCIGKRKRFAGMRIEVARDGYARRTRMSARYPQAEHLSPTVDRRDVQQRKRKDSIRHSRHRQVFNAGKEP
jgi:hypothetical protein